MQVAQAVADRARTVMRQAEEEAMRKTLEAPSVQPFLGFCSHLAKA